MGCQSIDITEKKYVCSSLDWFEIGRSDGVQGLNSLGWEKREQECSGFNDSHHESYVNGWYAGVNDFCSYSHGFAYGKSGHKYNNVCPAGKEPAFLEAYQKGMKVYRYEADNKQITQELQSINDKTSGNPKLVPELLKRRTELETKMELNQALITEINREMAEEPSSSSTL